MAKVKLLPELSRSELDIMKILWRDDQASAREVHDILSEEYDWVYSTTKTVMDRMVKKGHLARKPFHGVYLYRTITSKPAGLATFVRNFADQILELDYGSVVSLFARSQALTSKEIKELDALLRDSDDTAK